MPDTLGDILDGLQARLEGELRGNRAALTHPSARGDASEDDWLRLLKDHLPHRYQADKAFVIDSKGHCSDFIDIVIFDRQYSPLIYNRANQRYVPAESVYAVLEVKQELTREYVLYAGEKLESVRRLERTSAPIPYAAGAYPPRPLPRILGGLVAYQSSWTPPLGQPLRKALMELTEPRQLDLGCALRHGVFEVVYEKGSVPHINAVEDRRSLVQFMWRLLKNLQALGTVPAINYDEYLGHL